MFSVNESNVLKKYINTQNLKGNSGITSIYLLRYAIETEQSEGGHRRMLKKMDNDGSIKF